MLRHLLHYFFSFLICVFYLFLPVEALAQSSGFPPPLKDYSCAITSTQNNDGSLTVSLTLTEDAAKDLIKRNNDGTINVNDSYKNLYPTYSVLIGEIPDDWSSGSTYYWAFQPFNNNPPDGDDYKINVTENNGYVNYSMQFFRPNQDARMPATNGSEPINLGRSRVYAGKNLLTNGNNSCVGTGSAIQNGTSTEDNTSSDKCKNSSDHDECQAKNYCESTKGNVFARAFYRPDSEGTGCFTLPDFLATGLNYLMMFATLIAGFMFARGAMGILASRGNPTAVSEARDTLMQATVGLVILATAFIVINFLNGAFQGVDGGINLTGPWFSGL